MTTIIGLSLPACTAWQRGIGESRYSTPLPFTQPDPEHPLAGLDPDFPVAADARQPPAPATIPPRPAQAKATPGVHRVTSHGVKLTAFVFDDRDFSIALADQAGGPGSAWSTAQEAARAHQATAAINGGFFTPEGGPLGLVIEDGKRFGSWNRASSLTSGVFVTDDGQPRLMRREKWMSARSADHLVQTGPFLVEEGKAVSGLTRRSDRPRSFLAWDGRHHWILGFASATTLAELARALAAQPLSRFKLTTAVNLDGGRSSDLWVSSAIAGGPVSTRSFWNKAVRNYIIIEPRTFLP